MDAWPSTSSSVAWGFLPRAFAHLLGLLSVLLAFFWNIYFRGGINYNSSDTKLIFNVHPALMVLSLVFLATEATLAYKTIPGSKVTKKAVHLLLHLAALVLAIVGTCAVFKQHNLKGIDNLYSFHSWLGLITLILFGLQWLIGCITFFFPGFSQSTRSALHPWHVFWGLFIYGLCIASTELGLVEKLTILQQKSIIAKFSTEAMFVNILGLVVFLLAACVYLAAILPDFGTETEHEHYRLME